MTGRLQGKHAIVTGGASGIGREIAMRFAREGAAILVADRDVEGAAATVALIESGGGHAASCLTDVADRGSVIRMTATAQALWGGVDLLVNSAGIGEGDLVINLPEESWDRVLAVNLKGTFLCCQALLPELIARGGGSILNLASLAALRAAPGMGPYGASKAGVVQLTRILALEAAPHGVRVNALCPVWIETPMVERYLDRAADPRRARRELIRGIPLGRLGTVTDVASAALFLASDEAAFLTGLALPIDGGAACA